jgi:hypothetical protein
MVAEIFEVVQYAAACLECQWYGELHYAYNDGEDGKILAEQDMAKHNKKVHPHKSANE